jgi:uncharacterized protein with ACT and thioredoxin-like domain
LKGAGGAALRQIAADALSQADQPGHRSVRVMADVDPIEVL